MFQPLIRPFFLTSSPILDSNRKRVLNWHSALDPYKTDVKSAALEGETCQIWAKREIENATT